MITEPEQWHQALKALTGDLDQPFQESGGGLAALRAARLLRVAKLVRNWVALRILLEVVTHSIKMMGNFCLILVLFLYIFTLLGMTLFGDKMGPVPGGEKPRLNFDDFWWSFITVFSVLTGENWNVTMYSTGIATSQNVPIIVTSFYFLILVIVGNIILLNLFLAILLAAFTESRSIIL